MAISIYHTRNSLAASDKAQGDRDSHLRSSADACNLNVLAEVVHQRFAMDRDKVAYVAGDAIGGYAIGEFDLGDVGRYLGGRSRLMLDGKEIPPEHVADLHDDFVAACVKVAQYDRCKRFGTKTLPHAMILYVKANWLMLLLANQSALDGDSAIQETWLAIALSLYTLVLQCHEQWALVQGLRDLHLVLWKVVGRGVNVKDSALKASRTWKKQATLLAITSLVTLLAVIQTVGARMCWSHVFALKVGCVAAA